jgi:DNA-binding NtrC family response regulator
VPPHRSADEAGREGKNGTRGHVLVVDGDAGVRRSLTGIITRRGYGVLTAADVGEAVATVTRCHPVLLIVRSELPSGGYRSLLDSLHEPPPAIVLDAPGRASLRASADPRVVAVLTPPWPLADLYRVLELVDPGAGHRR